MTEDSEIRVILSDDLHRLLIARADGSDVPLDWFVAGLVCDTIESLADRWIADLASASTLRLLLPGEANASSAHKPYVPRTDPLRVGRRASEEV